MHFTRKRLCQAVLAITLTTGAAAVTQAAPPAQAASASTDYVIVELSSQAAARYQGGKKDLPATAVAKGRLDTQSGAYAAYKRFLENEHANFRAQLNKLANSAVVTKEMFATSNAVVVKLNGADIKAVKKISGVKAVYPSTLYKPNMDESVKLIGADVAWDELSDGSGRAGAGAGVRVAVIDSGIPASLIDGFHPFYDCKSVEFGGFFYSGETGTPAIAIKNPNGNVPAPGVAWVSEHGTHVGGTIGGCITTIGDGSVWDGTTLSGVAPGATLVDYNVFPGIGAGYVAQDGSAFSHDIADAIESAVVNGDDVINMSLGGGVQGPNDYLAQVSDAAVAAGVVVVTSAGNEGPGPYTVGSPGSAHDVITVGASTNSRGMGIEVYAPGFDPIRAYPGDFPDFDGTDQTLVDWPGADNEACNSELAPGAIGGEVVLIARGSCTFSQKMANAKAAGAGGVVVYSDDRAPGGMATTPGFDDQIPAVMISHEDGIALEPALPLSPVQVTPPTIVAETPNLLADFSSRGPVPFTGIVKPDVVAPGVNILSSVWSGWELYNGTSMASPHVAGAAAVILHEHPDWAPWEVKSALATTATKLPDLAPWEQGSGLINLPAALVADDFFQPTNASFGEFKGYAPATGTVDIAITSADECELVGTEGDDKIAASVADNVLSVSFDGGRKEAGGFFGGYVFVECGTDVHTIPWGAVVNR